MVRSFRRAGKSFEMRFEGGGAGKSMVTEGAWCVMVCSVFEGA